MNRLLLFSILTIVFFGCKTTKEVKKHELDVKKDVTVKVDSVKKTVTKTETTIADKGVYTVEIVDEWFAEPDTSGQQFVTRKTATKIEKKADKKATILVDVQENKTDKTQITDKTEVKESVKEEIKTKKGGFFNSKTFGIIGVLVIFVIGIILFERFF